MSVQRTMKMPTAMKTEFLQTLFKLLGGDDLRFVGGCVRNALLGVEITDIDMATPHEPQAVINILEDHKVKVVPTGIDHGTVTAISDEQRIEITTLRKDVETDGRRAVVGFTKEWSEDAQRRDFTMNALFADQQGNLFDPTGQGLKDLESRLVRFVGDPETRIAEDFLRILRFFRFHATYGEGEPDKKALEACEAAAHRIPELSRERITQEMFKILSLENPIPTLSLMFSHGVLRDLPGQDYDAEKLSALCYFQKQFGLAALSPRLMLLHADDLAQYLLVPKVFQKDIRTIGAIISMDKLSDDHTLKVAIYKHGRTATAQALMIELAQDRVNAKQAQNALQIIQKWDVPTFPITGQDLIKEGFKPGPDLGDELEKREEEWIKSL